MNRLALLGFFHCSPKVMRCFVSFVKVHLHRLKKRFAPVAGGKEHMLTTVQIVNGGCRPEYQNYFIIEPSIAIMMQ